MREEHFKAAIDAVYRDDLPVIFDLGEKNTGYEQVNDATHGEAAIGEPGAFIRPNSEWVLSSRGRWPVPSVMWYSLARAIGQDHAKHALLCASPFLLQDALDTTLKKLYTNGWQDEKYDSPQTREAVERSINEIAEDGTITFFVEDRHLPWLRLRIPSAQWRGVLPLSLQSWNDLKAEYRLMDLHHLLVSDCPEVMQAKLPRRPRLVTSFQPPIS